ncbi:MAG: metal ABC transporter substrate-binding protein, partial [Gemmataceae bacterium]
MRPWHLLTLFLQFCLIGCKADNSPAQHNHGGKMVVVATTGMIADMVQNITGDQAKVFCLMGSGVDPHSYEPRESDVTKIHEAPL